MSAEFEPQQPQEEVVAFSIPCEAGEMILHYFNTKIRTFRDEQFNHVEWRDENDTLKGIRVGQDLMDLLFENDFPYQFDPIVDEATREWFIQSEVRLLDKELDEL